MVATNLCRNKKNRSRQAGASLIEVLLAMGLIAIVGGSTATMLMNMQKEQGNISSKLETTNITSSVQSLFSRHEDCDCHVVGKTFNSSNPKAEIDLTEVKMSCAAGAAGLVKTPAATASTATVMVSRIYIGNIVSTGNSNEYTSNLLIDPQILGNSVRQFRSIPVPIRFYTDPASPASAKVITACGAAPFTDPKDLIAVPVGAAGGQCNLSWTPSSGANPILYTIKRSTNPSPNWNTVTTQACPQQAGSNCTAKSLTNGTKYYFAVQASNPYSSPSQWSNVASCTPVIPVGTPVISKTAANTQCTISWSPVAGTAPKTYTVYQDASAPATTSSSVKCNAITTTSCVSNGLTNGKTYYFAATASNAGSTSPLSNSVSCVPNPVVSYPGPNTLTVGDIYCEDSLNSARVIATVDWLNGKIVLQSYRVNGSYMPVPPVQQTFTKNFTSPFKPGDQAAICANPSLYKISDSIGTSWPYNLGHTAASCANNFVSTFTRGTGCGGNWANGPNTFNFYFTAKPN